MGIRKKHLFSLIVALLNKTDLYSLNPNLAAHTVIVWLRNSVLAFVESLKAPCTLILFSLPNMGMMAQG